VEKKYIASIPSDPGQSGNSSTNYTLSGGAFTCAVHGNADQSIKGSLAFPGDMLSQVMQSLPVGTPGMPQPDGVVPPDPSQMGDPSADPEAPFNVEPAQPPEGEETEEGEGSTGEGSGEGSEEDEEEGGDSEEGEESGVDKLEGKR
jgi:hypothetical protein